MLPKIYCKPTSKGIHSFYLIFDGNEYYLFSQNYRKGVARYYGGGVLMDNAMKRTKAHGDHSVLKTMEKLPMYLRYIEKEQGIKVLKK